MTSGIIVLDFPELPADVLRHSLGPEFRLDFLKYLWRIFILKFGEDVLKRYWHSAGQMFMANAYHH